MSLRPYQQQALLPLFLFIFCLHGARDLRAALPHVTEVAAEIARQDLAWNDLEVRYQFGTTYLTEKGDWEEQPLLQMNWKQTRDSWQRVRRERQADGGVWVEEASYDGEYYMSSDSQATGSGAVGHQNAPFLYNSNVPRMFGLAVTGVELLQPVSVAEFLSSKQSHVELTESTEGNLIVAKGADPMAVGVNLELHLDPSIGYRPRTLIISDKQGLLSIYTELEYEQHSGIRGKFWFPHRGTWKGFDPVERTEVSRLTYQAEEVLIDQNPKRDEFRLTYPSGALLLNSDTGESFYLKDDSTVGDVPNFTGKRLSLFEHDRQQEVLALPPVKPLKHDSFSLLIIVNVLLLVVVVILMRFKHSRKSP